jgi:hypothetical protein
MLLMVLLMEDFMVLPLQALQLDMLDMEDMVFPLLDMLERFQLMELSPMVLHQLLPDSPHMVQLMALMVHLLLEVMLPLLEELPLSHVPR